MRKRERERENTTVLQNIASEVTIFVFVQLHEMSGAVVDTKKGA